MTSLSYAPNQKQIEIIEEKGDWQVTSMSPLEITHKDGSYATGFAASLLWPQLLIEAAA
jgi:hypothetical protein